MNFNEIEQLNGKTIYILTMLVKRRTNNRHNELHSMMLNFIEQVQSIATMFSQYLCLKGWKVGLFTSPHIHTVRERVQLNGSDISEDKFAEYVGRLAEFVEDETYFELLNALAFQYFIDEGVDYAVLEVGLGGRLDSTNVVLPALSVITRIEMEHRHGIPDSPR